MAKDIPTIGAEVYLDGQIVAAAQAALSPFDRGFLFAHAAYEVTAVFDARLIDWPGHAARLSRTLAGLDLVLPVSPSELEAIHYDLLTRNGVTEGLVYLQVTGGAYGFRDFAGPETFDAMLFLFTSAKSLINPTARDGLKAITLPDLRWKRRDWKTTQLLAQTQAYRAARAAGADTAWMHEDGWVTEAASANAWIVTADGTLVTRDLSPAILPGITRDTISHLLTRAGLRVEERPFSLEETRSAAEAFTTSTGVMIAPILSLDGVSVGTGRPGPVTRTVQRLYYEYLGADVSLRAPWSMA